MINLKDLVFTQNNLISKQYCKYFIDFFENNKDKLEQENSLTYNDNKDTKNSLNKCMVLNLSKYQKQQKFKKPLSFALHYTDIIIKNYVNYLKVNISKNIPSHFMKFTDNVRIIKYEEGGYIDDHLDIDNFLSRDVRASCTLNLNDNYEGGSFNFFEKKYQLKLKEGQGLIFPADQYWIHGTSPVIKGNRYSINCFIKP